MLNQRAQCAKEKPMVSTYCLPCHYRLRVRCQTTPFEGEGGNATDVPAAGAVCFYYCKMSDGNYNFLWHGSVTTSVVTRDEVIAALYNRDSGQSSVHDCAEVMV
jgi:hypothetical protein